MEHKNNIQYNEELKCYEIELTQGQIGYFDEEDLELVRQHRWHARKNFSTYYARTNIKCDSPTRQSPYVPVPMHRLILDPPADMLVDHINHNGLDNRRSNIWVCTPADNSRNARHPEHRTRFGTRKDTVGYTIKKGLYQAQMTVNGRTKYIGLYRTPEEARAAFLHATGGN